MTWKVYPNVDRAMPGFVQSGITFESTDPNDPTAGLISPQVPIVVHFKDKLSKKTRSSTWGVAPVQGNMTNVPGPIGVGHKEVKETFDPQGKRIFANTVDLPDIGGDRHQVEVYKKRTLKSDRNVLSQELQTWRRLWVTIYTTDNSHAQLVQPLFDALETAFAGAFIEFVHVPAPAQLQFAHDVAISSERANLNHRQNAYGKAMFGGAWPTLERSPFHLMIVLLKYSGRRFDAHLTYQVAPGLGAFPQQCVATGKTGNDRWIRFNPPSRYYLRPTALGLAQIAAVKGRNHTLVDSITGFKVTSSAGPTIDLMGERAHLVDQWPHLKLDLAASVPLQGLGQRLDAGETLTFEFDLDMIDLSYAGSNYGNGIFMDTMEEDPGVAFGRRARAQGDLEKVVIHEAGHALGLTPNPLLPTGVRKTDYDYSRHYDKGTGPHCSYNTGAQQSPGNNMCIMFDRLHANAGPGFCDRCQQYLEQATMRSFAMGNFGWNTYKP